MLLPRSLGRLAAACSFVCAAALVVAGGAPPAAARPPWWGGADTTPPSTPTDLARAGATTSSLSLSWTGSTDDVGVAGYGLYQNDVAVGSTSMTSSTFDGLTCGTSYTFAV